MRHRLVAVLSVALLAPAAASAQPARAASSIDHVVVYSAAARVFRTATVTLERGPLVVALADLPDAVVPDSIRVECQSAAVQRVEVARTRDTLPRQDDAKALLARLQQVLEELRALDDEAAVLRAELGLLESVQPAPQRPRPEKEPAMLFVDTWRRVLAWGEGRATKLRARLTALGEERHGREQQLAALKVEARTLQLAAARAPAARVVVTVAGRPGRHRLVLSYLVGQVRWLPAYDLVYDDGRQSVEASYYALVTQASGEDWQDARLSFSTTTPATLVAVPELPTWTLGRRTDFTPTPRARVEAPQLVWSPPVLPEGGDELTAALGRLAGGEAQTRLEELEKKADELKQQVRRQRARVQLLDQTVLGGRVDAPPAPPPPAARGEAVALEAAPAARQRFSGDTWSPPPAEEQPWTDTGYVAPALDPDLPAAAAKGYRYTMDAPGRHSVAAAGVAVRVPLVRQRLGVSPIYTIVPGRSTAAYLTAAVENATGRPILRGQANLFVGALYSGQTRLETALPGAKLLLPLGVDDRVKVSRITTQRTVSEGVLFKDDVTEYTTTIEIANHRRHPVRVAVEDQVPVTKAEARLEGFAAEPATAAPDEDGRVKFEATVGGGSVQKLLFRYRIVRPKNWELMQ